MNSTTLKTSLLASGALMLGACSVLTTPYASYEPATERIVSGPELTGAPNPLGPLKLETPELRARLSDRKAFYRYQYAELWVVRGFPIERGVVVFAAAGRPLRSMKEIAVAGQCVDADLRQGGGDVRQGERRLLLPGTNGRDMDAWHERNFGKNNVPLTRACRVSVLFDM